MMPSWRLFLAMRITLWQMQKTKSRWQVKTTINKKNNSQLTIVHFSELTFYSKFTWLPESQHSHRCCFQDRHHECHSLHWVAASCHFHVQSDRANSCRLCVHHKADIFIAFSSIWTQEFYPKETSTRRILLLLPFRTIVVVGINRVALTLRKYRLQTHLRKLLPVKFRTSGSADSALRIQGSRSRVFPVKYTDIRASTCPRISCW